MLGLLKIAGGLASSFVEGKAEETKAKAKAKVMKAEAEAVVMQKVATGEVDWENTMADATKGSWKDEYLIIVLTIPAILAFIDADIVQRGFKVLESLPDWYQNLLYIAVTASFGIKATDFIKGGRGKK